MAFERYVIDDFMKAWFDKDYSKMPLDDFKIVYAEYLDTSGLFQSEDFERQSFIHHLNQRIERVKMYIRIQREFISEFDMPYILDFDDFRDKYGYVLKWKKDKEDFEKQLEKVEKREHKNITFLESKIKELNEFRNKKSKNEIPEDDEKSLKKSRHGFIKMLNSLGKMGYEIKRKETYVEELSLMIKQQTEENEQIESQNGR